MLVHYFVPNHVFKWHFQRVPEVDSLPYGSKSPAKQLSSSPFRGKQKEPGKGSETEITGEHLKGTPPRPQSSTPHSGPEKLGLEGGVTLGAQKVHKSGCFVVKSEQSSVKSKRLQTNFISFRTLLQRNQRQPRLLSHKYQLQAPAALFLYLERGYQLIQEHTTSVFLLTCAVFPILM